MDYFMNKKLNKEKAIAHTTMVCETYPEEIRECIKTTQVYMEEDCIELLKNNTEDTGDLMTEFKKEGVVKAVLDQKSKNVAVLNFASYKNPGGMFMEGSSAQEESICHSSILYPVLLSFDDTFYYSNRNAKNKSLYRNRMLYTPGVIFIGENGKTKKADVITMAAPNRKAALKNGVSEEEIEITMRERIHCILGAAKEHEVKVLILGAFGCGVFQNNPRVTARIMYEECRKFDGMKYVFPIPDDENYEAFWSTMVNEQFINFSKDFIEALNKEEE